jgi:hypothetical protein
MIWGKNTMARAGFARVGVHIQEINWPNGQPFPGTGTGGKLLAFYLIPCQKIGNLTRARYLRCQKNVAQYSPYFFVLLKSCAAHKV